MKKKEDPVKRIHCETISIVKYTNVYAGDW